MHNLSYLRVMSMGGHFFPNMNLHVQIFEPYLDCYGSIFSPNLVCCSWDYELSEKWSPIFNRMSGTWSNFIHSIKHITLICQHDKLPLVISSFVWILGPWYLKNRINNHVQIFTVSMSSIGIALITSFYVITQPWRQLGAILCFHVIINIFITIHHKLTKFNTHKLQVIL